MSTSSGYRCKHQFVRGQGIYTHLSCKLCGVNKNSPRLPGCKRKGKGAKQRSTESYRLRANEFFIKKLNAKYDRWSTYELDCDVTDIISDSNFKSEVFHCKVTQLTAELSLYPENLEDLLSFDECGCFQPRNTTLLIDEQHREAFDPEIIIADASWLFSYEVDSVYDVDFKPTSPNYSPESDGEINLHSKGEISVLPLSTQVSEVKYGQRLSSAARPAIVFHLTHWQHFLNVGPIDVRDAIVFWLPSCDREKLYNIWSKKACSALMFDSTRTPGCYPKGSVVLTSDIGLLLLAKYRLAWIPYINQYSADMDRILHQQRVLVFRTFNSVDSDVYLTCKYCDGL